MCVYRDSGYNCKWKKIEAIVIDGSMGTGECLCWVGWIDEWIIKKKKKILMHILLDCNSNICRKTKILILK